MKRLLWDAVAIFAPGKRQARRRTGHPARRHFVAVK
jgi:hypothetical protein